MEVPNITAEALVIPPDNAPFVAPVIPASSSDLALLPLEPAPIEPTRPIYRTPAELHQRPIPLKRIDLAAFGRQYPGSRARLSIFIDTAGVVNDVRILDPSDQDMAEAFKLFIGKIHFVPGKIAGQAVNSELRLEIVVPAVMLDAVQNIESMSPTQVPSAAGN